MTAECLSYLRLNSRTSDNKSSSSDNAPSPVSMPRVPVAGEGGRKFALTKARVPLPQAAMPYRDSTFGVSPEVGIKPTLYR